MCSSSGFKIEIRIDSGFDLINTTASDQYKIWKRWFAMNQNNGAPAPVTKVNVRESPVELYKILKMENLAASGGEAKFLIAGGQVKVNGEIETRKRKKIFPGDVIEWAGSRLQVFLQGN
jgi:ribosome-associated protein